MPSQVFYRKWRPQRLDQVVGQEPVTRTLHKAIATGRVAHAYLFCGPRGTGKTSTARILAKAVNCLEPDDSEPCGHCQMCQAVNEGRPLDLIEIDAASHRGIDEIRNLREKIHFTPNEARFKVYIMDEVHMLTEAAFNALLKTLEEPPDHAIFVLATTEAHKVPLTVASRCQRFDFRRIPPETTVERLQKLCGDEGIEVELEALRAIARSASGSLRDAENLLEQLVVSYTPPITMEHVRSLFGLEDDEDALELVDHILNGRVQEGLITINKVASQGHDLRQLHRNVLELLRSTLLLKSGVGSSQAYPRETMSRLETLANSASMERILAMVKAFAQPNMRLDGSSPLTLELALVESALRPSEAKTDEKSNTSPRASVANPTAGVREPKRVEKPPTPNKEETPAAVARPSVAPRTEEPPTPNKEETPEAMAQPSVAPRTEEPPTPNKEETPAAVARPSVAPRTEEPPTPNKEETPEAMAQPSVAPRTEEPPTPNKEEAPAVMAQPSVAPRTEEQKERASTPGTPAKTDDQFSALVKSLSRYKGKRFNIGALLRDCKTHYVEDQRLVLKFNHRSHMERMSEEMDDPQSRKAIMEAVAQAMGTPYEVQVDLANDEESAHASPPSKSHLVKAALAMGATVIEEKGDEHE